MPESRDRLSRPVDVAAVFARRRRAIRGLNIFSDESAEESFGGTPFRWGTTPMTGFQGQVGVAAVTGRGGGGVGRGSVGTPRRGIIGGRENSQSRSYRRGQGRGTMLPSWYPRTPLSDVTAVVRAMERRRGSLREMEGLQLGTPRPQNRTVIDPSAKPTANAQLEHHLTTPNPAAGKRPCPCPPSVAKILLNITSQKEEGENLDGLTPQKKLLNSLDTVGKAVMEELEKMRKTPSAKRATRDRKIRTLMSMR